MSLQIQSMQDTLDNLVRNLGPSCGRQGTITPVYDMDGHNCAERMPQQVYFYSYSSLDQPQSLCPGFRGPTSSSYTFDVANSSLRRMGITSGGSAVDSATSREKRPLISRCQADAASGPFVRSFARDPLGEIGYDEALRLCQLYNEAFGTMYPVIDMHQVIANAESFFAPIGSSTQARSRHRDSSMGDTSFSNDVNVLKLVLAISLASVSAGKDEQGQRLFQSVRDAAEVPIWDSMGLEGIQLLTLVVQYFEPSMVNN